MLCLCSEKIDAACDLFDTTSEDDRQMDIRQKFYINRAASMLTRDKNYS